MQHPVELAAPVEPVVNDHADVAHRVDEDDRQHQAEADHQDEEFRRAQQPAADEGKPHGQQELKQDRDRGRFALRVHSGHDPGKHAGAGHAVPHAGRDVLGGEARGHDRGEHGEQRDGPDRAPDPVGDHQGGKFGRRGELANVEPAPADDLAPDDDDRHQPGDDDGRHRGDRDVPARTGGLLGERHRGFPASESLYGEHDGQRETGRRGQVSRVEARIEYADRESAGTGADEPR